MTRVNEILEEELGPVEAAERIAELEESFDLYYDAIQRGTKLWQKATGLHEVLPDTGELVAWLLDLVHRTNPDTNRHESVVGEPDAAPNSGTIVPNEGTK